MGYEWQGVTSELRGSAYPYCQSKGLPLADPAVTRYGMAAARDMIRCRLESIVTQHFGLIIGYLGCQSQSLLLKLVVKSMLPKTPMAP